jgi:hypothetical protein
VSDNNDPSGQAIFEEELAKAPRNTDGGLDEKKLLDAIADRLDVDVAAIKVAEAKRLIERNRKPGVTEPDGQLFLPGLEPCAYEPNRLVMDDDHHLIEQAKSTPRYKTAEAKRSRINAQRALAHSNRKATEAELFAEWVIEQQAAGRKQKELIFETFVKETGLWASGEAEPEPDPDAS